MAIWKEQTTPKGTVTATPEPLPIRVSEFRSDGNSSHATRSAERESTESVVTAGLVIEGKIEGAGHVRIAGRFKGDVHVQGNLTIEPGATLTGVVRAGTVTIGGELDGNVESATRVELLASGVLNGNLNAGSLTVAAGSKMRGQAEFGWEERSGNKAGPIPERSSTP